VGRRRPKGGEYQNAAISQRHQNSAQKQVLLNRRESPAAQRPQLSGKSSAIRNANLNKSAFPAETDISDILADADSRNTFSTRIRQNAGARTTQQR